MTHDTDALERLREVVATAARAGGDGDADFDAWDDEDESARNLLIFITSPEAVEVLAQEVRLAMSDEHPDLPFSKRMKWRERRGEEAAAVILQALAARALGEEVH